MTYKGTAKTLLDSFGVKEGDAITIRAREGLVTGVIMPRPESSDDVHLIIKLANGYNVGVEIDGTEEIKKREQPKQAPAQSVQRETVTAAAGSAGLPKISLIYTGGTIGSRVDYKTGGVSALTTTRDFVDSVPRIASVASLERVTNPFSLDSADATHKEWIETAQLVARDLNDGARGVVVAHGTDTLHYTSAALAFMLPRLNAPVAVVGAQRSTDRGSFDGELNLFCAARLAVSDFAGVAIVMHATESDDYCAVLPATKTRKMHSSRRDAFKPINASPLGKIFNDGKIEWNGAQAKRDESRKEKIVADTRFNPQIALLKAYPSSDPALLDFLVDKGVKGVVFEGTGLGYVPTQTRDEKYSWLPAVKRAADKGVVLAMTTQCLFGRVHPFVYSDLRLLSGAGVLYCEDLLPETAFVKLGCALARAKSSDEAKKLMLENWVGEVGAPTRPNEYLN